MAEVRVISWGVASFPTDEKSILSDSVKAQNLTFAP
jgi:hypothetical protein